MFGIGSTELLVILVVALVVLGPKSLATISRSLGKAMGEFRRVSTDFQRTLNAEAAQEEEEARRKKAAEKAAKVAAEAEAAKADRLERSASGETAATEPAPTPETPVADAAPSTAAPRPEAAAEAAAPLQLSRTRGVGRRAGETNHSVIRKLPPSVQSESCPTQTW